MALIYTCDVCEDSHDAEVSTSGEIIYFDGNRRVTVKKSSDPCAKCQTEIEAAKIEAEEKIKARKKAEVKTF